jgi:hypothetical protein
MDPEDEGGDVHFEFREGCTCAASAQSNATPRDSELCRCGYQAGRQLDTSTWTIPHQVSECMACFQRLMRFKIEDGLRPRFNGEHSRFKVWAGNIGAHHRGRRSLEYRLRDASNINDQVLELLREIREELLMGLFLNISLTESAIHANVKSSHPDRDWRSGAVG